MTTMEKCIYRAVVYDAEKLAYIKSKSRYERGFAIYAVISVTAKHMHMSITNDELFEIGEHILRYIRTGREFA